MYDAIIVGARCAGAPTAMRLARRGYRTLLVDKATFPSDTLSTHIVWPHGAEIMDRWGLLDRLAATGCPPIARRLVFHVGPFALTGGVTDTNGGRGGFCPRRTVLDKLLVDAAVEAGADLREAFTVDALLWAASRFQEIRADVEGHVRQVLTSMPTVAERLLGATREEQWFGTAGIPNYFRQPFGPGWALVGDAGYCKDPITAQGISDAFLDADGLAAALDEGWSGNRSLDDALAAHQASRDRRVKAMYDFTCQMALLEPPPQHMQRLFVALRGNQEATNEFYSALTGSRPLSAFMNPRNLERITVSV